MLLRLPALFACICFATAICPENWAQYGDECFYFGHDRQYWTKSQDICKKMGGYLITDDNAAKHNFVRQLASVMHSNRVTRYWLGATDYAIEGSWRWLETGVEVGPYTKWAAGRPGNNKTQDCMALEWLGNDVEWVDISCNDRITSYICEKPVGSP